MITMNKVFYVTFCYIIILLVANITTIYIGKSVEYWIASWTFIALLMYTYDN